MAFKNKNHNFKINGVNTKTILLEKDYSLSQQERINLMNSLLYDEKGFLVPCLSTFFDGDLTEVNMCPALATTKSPLSTDINICKDLENMANYILYSPDGERLTQQTEYNIYTDTQSFRRSHREKSYDGLEDIDGAIDILIEKNRNYLLEKNQKIYSRDLFKYKELKDCQEIIDKLVDVLKKIPQNSIKRKKIGSIISGLREQQKNRKSSLCGTIIFKHISSNGEKIEGEYVDGFDFEKVKKMFLDSNPKHMTPFGELGEVLGDILENIDKKEQEVLIMPYLYGKEKINYSLIARELGISSSYVRQIFEKLRIKIIKHYMRAYENWYYTFEDYGWYKTCSSCREVFLLSPTYFYRDTSSNDGFRSVCKKCN